MFHILKLSHNMLHYFYTILDISSLCLHLLGGCKGSLGQIYLFNFLFVEMICLNHSSEVESSLSISRAVREGNEHNLKKKNQTGCREHFFHHVDSPSVVPDSRKVVQSLSFMLLKTQEVEALSKLV